MRRVSWIALLALAQLGWTQPADAQSAKRDYVISIYKAAPGQQVALLRWLAREDEVAAAAGVPKSQLYDHFDGADWDYLVIAPLTTKQENDATDAVRKRMGLTTGLRRAIDFRKIIHGHTDTLVHGPSMAADLLKAIGETGQ